MSQSSPTQEPHERFEPFSLGWVNALRTYQEGRAEGKVFDFDVVWSAEYRDPPAHLLRDGRESVGYTIKVKDGKLEVIDGPNREEANVWYSAPYDPAALVYKGTLDAYMQWLKDVAPRLREEGKMIRGGNEELIKPLVPQLNMLEFYFSYSTQD